MLTIPAVFSVHAYYSQKKEIEFLKAHSGNCFEDAYLKINKALYNITFKAANIYHNFAFISHNTPSYSLSYRRMALEEYIEINNQKMIRQLLHEIIPIIKNIGDSLLPQDKTELSETINKIDKNQFSSEIQKINEMI